MRVAPGATRSAICLALEDRELPMVILIYVNIMMYIMDAVIL